MAELRKSQLENPYMRHISCSRVVSIGLVVLAAINAPALAEPFQHKFGELREYHKHWLAVCPNRHVPSEMMSYGSTCWASTYTGTDGFFLDDRLSFDGYLRNHAVRLALPGKDASTPDWTLRNRQQTACPEFP